MRLPQNEMRSSRKHPLIHLPFHLLLLNNQIEEFETRLTQHFFKKSRQNFGFEFDYTDWIRDFYRKLNYTRSVNSILVTDYISQTKMNSFDEMEFLFRLLQFLSFIRKFEGVKQCIDDQTYYIVEFCVVDFIRFLGKDPKSSYQRSKLLEFFKSLQKLPPFVDKFSDMEFRSSIMFPLVKLSKQGRSWILKVAIGNQLYSYSYPFVFKNSLCNYQSKYDLLIKLKIIEVLSTTNLEKKFCVEDFLNQFSISNQKQREIKKRIVDLLNELITSKALESDFGIVFKDNSKKEFDERVNKLTTSLLSKSKDIFLYEIID